MEKRGNIDWLATVFYPLAVVLMEAFWVFPWLLWLGSWPVYAEARAPLGLLAVIIVPAVALAATRFVNRHEEWPLAWARAAVLGLGAAAFFVTLRIAYPPPDGTGWFAYLGDVLGSLAARPTTIVLAAPALVYLWWRGIVLGRTTSYFRDVYKSFILGVVLLVLLIIFWQMTSGNPRFAAPEQDLGFYVIAFFFFGLLAIAVCHLYTIRRSMPREEAALTSVRRWLPIMLGVVGGMVLVGFAVAGIFSPGFFEGVGRVASAVSQGLNKLLEYVLIPIGYVMEGVLWLLRWLVSLLRRLSPPQEDAPPPDNEPLFQNVTTRDLPPEVLGILKGVLAVIILGLIVFLLARAIQRGRARRQYEDIEEINESLFSWAGLRNDLKDFLGNLKNRFTPKRQPRPVTYGDEVGDLDVREIYRRLLWESSRSGLPRRPAETVEEYAARLGRLVPDSAPPLGGLNPSYSEARYGELALDGERVRDTNRLWVSLRGVLRKLRGADE